jgi:hypothetical protein
MALALQQFLADHPLILYLAIRQLPLNERIHAALPWLYSSASPAMQAIKHELRFFSRVHEPCVLHDLQLFWGRVGNWCCTVDGAMHPILPMAMEHWSMFSKMVVGDCPHVYEYPLGVRLHLTIAEEDASAAPLTVKLWTAPPSGCLYHTVSGWFSAYQKGRVSPFHLELRNRMQTGAILCEARLIIEHESIVVTGNLPQVDEDLHTTPPHRAEAQDEEKIGVSHGAKFIVKMEFKCEIRRVPKVLLAKGHRTLGFSYDHNKKVLLWDEYDDTFNLPPPCVDRPHRYSPSHHHVFKCAQFYMYYTSMIGPDFGMQIRRADLENFLLGR